MSAIPIPRGESARAPCASGADLQGLVDAMIEDPNLDPLDVSLYLWMDRWNRLHPGWWPTQRQIGAAMKRSASVVCRCIKRLIAAGYLIEAANPADGVRGASTVYMLTRPGPAMSRPPAPEESQGDLFGQGMGARRETKPGDARNESPGPEKQDDGDPGAPAAVSPPTPPCIDLEFEKTTSVGSSSFPGSLSGEEIEELTRLAFLLVPKATRQNVAEALADFGAELLRRALGAVEAHNRRTARTGDFKVQGWGWVVNAMTNMRRAEKLAEAIPAPAEPQAPPDLPPAKPAEPKPGPPAEPAPEPLSAAELAEQIATARKPGYEGKIGRHALRLGVKSGQIDAADVPPELLSPEPVREAHEKPATGLHANASPSPAPELIEVPDVSYRAQMCTASAPETQSAHCDLPASKPDRQVFRNCPEYQATPPTGRSSSSPSPASCTIPIDRTPDPHPAGRAASDPAPARVGDVMRRFRPMRC